MADEKVLDKVRKLLAQAEHPNTSEAEAQAFSARAEALMFRHKIDEAMLQDGKVDPSDIGMREIKVQAPYAKEKTGLLHTIVKANDADCVANVQFSGNRATWGAGAKVQVYGFRGDLERIEVLYTSLLLQANRDMLRQRIPVRWGGRQEDPATFRSSWLLGFTQAVHDRLQEIKVRTEQEADAGSRGAELVLADRSALVKRALTEAHPDLRRGSGISSSGSGTRAGYRSGRAADLGQTRMGGGGRAALTR